MVHTGVSNNGHVKDIGAFNPCNSRGFFHDSIETIDDCLVHILQAFWVGHGVTDAGHDIFTINHLWIHHGSCGNQFTIRQVTKITCHCGGSDIDRQAVYLFHKPWFYFDHFSVVPHGNSNLPIPLTHCLL